MCVYILGGEGLQVMTQTSDTQGNQLHGKGRERISALQEHRKFNTDTAFLKQLLKNVFQLIKR